MSRPTPRRPASSRGSTPRPRKIAGQPGPARPGEDEGSIAADSTPSVPSASSATVESAAKISLAKPAAARESAVRVSRTTPADARPGILARQKTTRVLIATLALVAVASVAQFGILLWDRLGDDEGDTRVVDDTGQLTVPEGRPVVADELAVLDGVEQAAKAAQEIVAISYQSYDEEVDKAAELMTTQFEEQYRTTATDIQEEFVANKTAVQANVVAQGVVRANLTRLEALIFLNQVVSRERDGEPETVVTPYKVLVTMVHTDQGWLVDGLDTDAQEDKTN